MKYKNIILLVAIVLTVIFSVQNSEIVQVKLMFWEIKTPRALLIIISLIIGLVIGFLFATKKSKS